MFAPNFSLLNTSEDLLFSSPVIKKAEMKLKHSPMFSYENMFCSVVEDDEKQQVLA